MVTSIDALADAVASHLDARADPPGIIALGEPTHGEPAFLALWSAVLDRVVDRGVRSVALETDGAAALHLDAWARGGPGSLDEVLEVGFTHGFGAREGMRELMARLRVRNDERPPADRVAVYGIDLPTEASGAPSPRPHLEHLCRYLADTLGTAPVDLEELRVLAGPDEPWGTWEAQLDPAASLGASPSAVALRLIADDLVTRLYEEAPRLVTASSRAAWRAAAVHGRSALGLLRYHAVAAETAETAETAEPTGSPETTRRVSRLLGVRDAGMARHLLALRDVERGRGPTLVLTHNAHLQRPRSTWAPGGDFGWASAGSIVEAVGDDEYLHLWGALGAGHALGLASPPSGTVEAALLSHAPGGGLLTGPLATDGLRARDDVLPEQGYGALDHATVAGADGIVLLDVPGPVPSSPTPPSVLDLAARLLARPGVTHLRAGDDAPAVARGHWFFSARPDTHPRRSARPDTHPRRSARPDTHPRRSARPDRMPFATIVDSDYPGHDETSRLDRDGVFRLNLGVGRAHVPDDLADDPADLDRFLAHPVYGPQGWVSILCPSSTRLPEIDRLIDAALARARRG